MEVHKPIPFVVDRGLTNQQRVEALLVLFLPFFSVPAKKMGWHFTDTVIAPPHRLSAG